MGEIIGDSIGERIQYLRKKKGWTQTQLGSAMRVSRDVVTKWEGNKIDISSSYVSFLADIFDVSCDYIITGKECENRYTIDTLGISQSAITSLENRLNTTHDVNPDENMEWINHIITTLIDNADIFELWRSAKSAQWGILHPEPEPDYTNLPALELTTESDCTNPLNVDPNMKDNIAKSITRNYLLAHRLHSVDAYYALGYFTHELCKIIENSLLEGLTNGKA